MSKSKQSVIFGIHSITPYDLKTGKPLSARPFDVIGNFSVTLTQNIEEHFGGSNFDAFDRELGVRTFEGNMLLKYFPSTLIEIVTGSKPTENAAEAAGSVSALKNILNSSVFDVATGIASVGLTSAAALDIPFARYIIEAVSATTINIFVQSDVDFAQGADKKFVAGTHKINEIPLTITMGGTTVIPDFGIEVIGGSGTIAMVAGDTATFESKPANISSRSVVIGSPLARPKEIGLIAYTQRKSDGSMYKINIHSALAADLPLTLTEKAYSEAEITFKAIRAINIMTGLEGLYSLDQVISSGAC